MLPKIYMSRMDVEEEYFDAFMTWCKCRHWPDLVAVGFHSANGYLSEVGAPRACNVYEIPGVEVFSADYDHIREVDEELKVIVAEKISNHSLTVHDQVLTFGMVDDPNDQDGPSLASSWSCPAMSAVRFEIDPALDDEVIDHHRSALPELAQRASFLRARLLRQAEKHPTYPSDQPRWALLVEWADLDAAIAHEDTAGALLTDRFGQQVSRIMFNSARQVFSLRNPHGWRP